MKRLFSLTIAVCMLIGITTVAPISVGAVETQKITTGITSGDYEYELLDDGTAEITGYTGSDTSITIPSQIDGYTVTTIGFLSFECCDRLASITIPDSVTIIDNWAFSDCTSLTRITIPDSVTTIGICAFSGTSWYDNQPDGLVYAGKVAYKYKGDCPSEVIIKDGTKGIGGGAFEDCTSLTNITIPDSVTSIGDYAFNNCTSLTSVTIGNGVTTIGSRAFSYCESLTSIKIPDSVTTIGNSAFSGCTSLTSITIPDSVTTIGNSAFSGCTSLTSITIPDSVTIIGGYAFYGTAWYNNQPDGLVYAGRVAYKYKGECPSEVIIKDGTKSIVCKAFEYCRNLTSITIPDSVIDIGVYAFEDCKSLTSITIPDSVITIGDYAFEDCTSLTSITIPDSVTAIGDCAFYKCKSLTSITIPDSVINIGVYAFGYYYISDDDIDIKIDNFIIYGYPNSTAEKYAKNNGFNFVSLGEMPTTRPTTVKKTTITLAKSSATVYRTGKTAIKATVKNGKGKTTYKSSNTKIAKVTSKGVVTGVSKGTARITVANNGVKKVFTVKVNNPTPNKNSVSIKKGKTFTLKIAGKIGTAKFTSSNKKIATVNAKGKITAKKKGTVTIKVKTNGITLVCKVKVK